VIEKKRGTSRFGIHGWQAISFALMLLLATACLALVRISLPAYRNLKSSVASLNADIVRLKAEQNAPALLLARYRNSICYIYAAWTVNRPAGLNGPGRVQLRSSGTGFVVGNGLVATNHHVIEPDFESADAKAYVRAGALPRLNKLIAFFPGLDKAVPLQTFRSARHEDIALVRFSPSDALTDLQPLPLARSVPAPGEVVVVIGYPAGVDGMVAKSPRRVYERLALKDETFEVANDLAAMSLIRPSATFGHLGDVVADKLIYDASTTNGASGSPVLNTRGEVIAINTGYMREFAGGALGLSVDSLKALVQRPAQVH
jgi:S1-C subfamily serine protease